ncbi:MAG TPA: YbaB/EbfC family nucleoid-associated protein [Jatrophihabitantaceae bacterium]
MNAPTPASAGIAGLDERIAAIRGTAQGQDGLITAVVDGRSELVELTFEPKVMRLPAEDLAAAVRDTVNEARTAAQAQLRQVLADNPVQLPGADTMRAELNELGVSAERRLNEMSNLLGDLLKRSG